MVYIVDATVRLDAETTTRHIGKFGSVEEAVAAAQRVVNNILQERFRVGMRLRELFSTYEQAGIFPYIFLDHDENTFNVRTFNHYQYALKRCEELCRGQESASGLAR